MSYLDDLGGLVDAYGDTAADAYLRGAVMRPLIAEGYSGGSALRELQSMGLSYRSQDFYRAWNAVSAQMASAAGSSALAWDASSGELLPHNPPANWTGQYTHQVTATFRQATGTGSYTTSTRTFGVKSLEALSPLAASQAALSVLYSPTSPDDELKYPQVADLMNLQMTGIWYTTSPGATGRIGA